MGVGRPAGCPAGDESPGTPERKRLPCSGRSRPGPWLSRRCLALAPAGGAWPVSGSPRPGRRHGPDMHRRLPVRVLVPQHEAALSLELCRVELPSCRAGPGPQPDLLQPENGPAQDLLPRWDVVGHSRPIDRCHRATSSSNVFGRGRPVLFKLQGGTTVPAEVWEVLTDRVEPSVGAEAGKGRSGRCGRASYGSGSWGRGRSSGPATCRVYGPCRACGSSASATAGENAARVAREFGIPKVYGGWEHVIEDDQVNAILIGAWPYLHCPVTLAAFDANKHVLTRARMAMNAREAQRMYDRARELPAAGGDDRPQPLRPDWRRLHAVADFRRVSRDLARGPRPRPDERAGRPEHAPPLAADDQVLGLQHADAGYPVRDRPAWTPPVNRVFAYASKVIPTRLDPETGKPVRVGTPDSLQVLTTQEDSSSGSYRLSGVIWHNTGLGIAFYGSDGTLIYDLTRDEILGAAGGRPWADADPRGAAGGMAGRGRFHRGDPGRTPRDSHRLRHGVRSMQFTEAVAGARVTSRS